MEGDAVDGEAERAERALARQLAAQDARRSPVAARGRRRSGHAMSEIEQSSRRISEIIR